MNKYSYLYPELLVLRRIIERGKHKMRIIREGKKEDQLVKFVCKCCHCEFECNKDEYWENKTFVLTTVPPQSEFFANCPECHRMCKTYKTKISSTLTGDLPVINYCGDSDEPN